MNSGSCFVNAFRSELLLDSFVLCDLLIKLNPGLFGAVFSWVTSDFEGDKNNEEPLALLTGPLASRLWGRVLALSFPGVGLVGESTASKDTLLLELDFKIFGVLNIEVLGDLPSDDKLILDADFDVERPIKLLSFLTDFGSGVPQLKVLFRGVLHNSISFACTVTSIMEGMSDDDLDVSDALGCKRITSLMILSLLLTTLRDKDLVELVALLHRRSPVLQLSFNLWLGSLKSISLEHLDSPRFFGAALVGNVLKALVLSLAGLSEDLVTLFLARRRSLCGAGV